LPRQNRKIIGFRFRGLIWSNDSLSLSFRYDAHQQIQTTFIPINELLPALSSVKSRGIVEAWAEEEGIEEPTAERPFQLHYNPALGWRII
jgi:hypothetical protein